MTFKCTVCGDMGWVCENHPDRPWGSDHPNACRCGGAGMPCLACNQPEEGERPRLPVDFIARLDRDNLPIH